MNDESTLSLEKSSQVLIIRSQVLLLHKHLKTPALKKLNFEFNVEEKALIINTLQSENTCEDNGIRRTYTYHADYELLEKVKQVTLFLKNETSLFFHFFKPSFFMQNHHTLIDN